VLELADAESGTVGLDDECRDAPRVPGSAIGHREHNVEVGDSQIGDPVLGAVDDPLVAVALGARDHAAGVRAGLRLREGKRRRPLA
jgi:hypothetical protein